MYHVIHTIQRVPDDIVTKYATLSSATVHEASGGKGALSSRIKPISPDMTVCGPVVTVKLRPGDNLMLHKAIYVAQAGDVIVADAEGYTEAGAWGEIMAVAAHKRGLAGLVFNGAVRDSREMTSLGFPVFACGLSIKGTGKINLGQINHPLIMDNITINPGDLVLGDRDGVVIVDRRKAQAVLDKSMERVEKETLFMQGLEEGKTTLELAGFDDILANRKLTEEMTGSA